MPIIRNPFRRQDENARPDATVAEKPNATTTPPKSIDLAEKQDTEYKLSEINDSGVCLPPSPGEERKSFWGHTNSSRSTTSSTTHRSLIKENEPFNISRESFDSYRRSFDISGRSPVISGDRPRASLDSRTFQSFQSSPRKSTNLQRPAPVPLTLPMREEEDFEDVGLHDDPKPAQQSAAPKKRGFLSRLTESSNDQAAPGATSGQESKWHFGGRKRRQSGQGAELGSMPQPSRENTPKPVAPESGLRHSETPKQNGTRDKADGNAQTPTPTES